ncbi:PrpF domain-containing protein [Streptomyces ziwulingensis]|uniref:PrpF domain-containing protein n=1 Tax=Streptomyces ziwulingensis TaxID=1045501 RepID=A0ABP9D0K4_9ACTN
MIAHLAYATGSPCPTLVLDADTVPETESGLLEHLAAVRRHLDATGNGHVLKIALVRPSRHPMFDLEYRFVQALPGSVDAFDLRGSCGHSILSSAVVAERMGMLPRLSVGARVRVRVLNNGDSVVCEVDAVDRGAAQFTVHFVRTKAIPVTDLLITGEPRTMVAVDGELHEVSLVSSGNAYAFLDARTVGIKDPDALFAGGEELFDTLARIRAAVTDHLGWPPGGAFPKIAALLPVEAGRIAARAISVPSWHPTIALTGAVCLGSAIRIPGTVPWRVAQELGCPDSLEIITSGGRTAVTADVRDIAGTPTLSWASVDRKRVTFQGSIPLEPSASATL